MQDDYGMTIGESDIVMKNIGKKIICYTAETECVRALKYERFFLTLKEQQ